MTKPPALVPVDLAAVRLHRHPQTLRRDLRAGRLPGTKIGGRWFMSTTDIDRITRGGPLHVRDGAA